MWTLAITNVLEVLIYFWWLLPYYFRDGNAQVNAIWRSDREKVNYDSRLIEAECVVRMSRRVLNCAFDVCGIKCPVKPQWRISAITLGNTEVLRKPLLLLDD